MKTRMTVARVAFLIAAILPATLLLGSAPSVAEGAALAAAAPQQPTFSNGEAQPVFRGQALVKDEVWIAVPGVDTDRNGKDDDIRATVFRPKDTDLGSSSVKLPSVVHMSPYNGGFNDEYFVHDMRREGWDPSQPVPVGKIGTIRKTGSASEDRTNDSYYTDRGFAYVSVDSLGTHESTGCPTMVDANEAAATKAVVDWLAGRTTARSTAGRAVSATSWSTGKVGMTGVSYDGTLPILASTTGVSGLEAVVPVSALSNFYGYYRVGGAVVEPAGYPGEDLDNYVSALLSRDSLRSACQYLAEDFAKKEDRATGQYNDFWQARDFFSNIDKVKTPTLLAAGLSDWNVRLDQATTWYSALKQRNVPVKLILHQYGHQTPPSSGDFNWTSLLNKWFTHYLFGVDNGVEKTSEVSVQDQNRKTWTYADSWPLPGSKAAEFGLRAGTGQGGALIPGAAAAAQGVIVGDGTVADNPVQTLTDDAKTSQQNLAAKQSNGRLLYSSVPAKNAVRISGFARARLNLAFSSLAPNLSLQLLDRSPDGSARVITRAWQDPQNRESLTRSLAVTPGSFYQIDLPFISTEYVLAKDHKVEMMLYATDIDGSNCTTICPSAGAKISIEVNKSVVSLPVVGGAVKAVDALG